MDRNTAQSERKFAITPEEQSAWEENGYFVRYDVLRKQKTTAYDTSLTILLSKTTFSRKQISIKTPWSEMEKWTHRVSRQCTKSIM